jgi:hypothetical protein
VETTMHLLFECTKCAEPLWNIVEETINALKANYVMDTRNKKRFDLQKVQKMHW